MQAADLELRRRILASGSEFFHGQILITPSLINEALVVNLLEKQVAFTTAMQ
jgi:hypothetical protein